MMSHWHSFDQNYRTVISSLLPTWPGCRWWSGRGGSGRGRGWGSSSWSRASLGEFGGVWWSRLCRAGLYWRVWGWRGVLGLILPLPPAPASSTPLVPSIPPTYSFCLLLLTPTASSYLLLLPPPTPHLLDTLTSGTAGCQTKTYKKYSGKCSVNS